MGNAGSHGMQGEQHLMSFDCCGGSRLDEVRNAQLILPCPRVCSHVRMLQPFHGRSRSGSRSRLFQDCINARHGRQNDNCSVASTTQDPAPLRVTSRLTSRKRACARLDLKEREAAAFGSKSSNASAAQRLKRTCRPSSRSWRRMLLISSPYLLGWRLIIKSETRGEGDRRPGAPGRARPR